MPASNGYNFTERVRAILASAREEAHAASQSFVGTEHELLAMIHEGEGVGVAVLQALGADLRKIEESVRSKLHTGKHPESGPDLPYTSDAKKALELSMSAARDCDHSYVGSEHLLLGLIREENGIAGEVLREAGFTYHSVLHETLRLLGSTEATGVLNLADATKAIVRVTVLILRADGTGEERSFDRVESAIRYLNS